MFDELRVKNMEFTMAVTYLELYNEELIDLLSPEEDNSKLRFDSHYLMCIDRWMPLLNALGELQT